MRTGAAPRPATPIIDPARMSELWDALEFVLRREVHLLPGGGYVLLMFGGYSWSEDVPMAASGEPMDAGGEFLALAIPQSGTEAARKAAMRTEFVTKMAERLR